MVFVRDILFPVVVLIIAVSAVSVVVNFFFRLIKFDVTILKIAAFIAIWYYVGPIIYSWFDYHVLSVKYEAIRILYTPAQYIISVFEKIL